MITLDEILKGVTPNPDHLLNLELLLEAMNYFRKEYAKPMIVTSGYRTLEHHKEIYKKKGIFNPPLKSNHLKGLAVDILDEDGMLKNYICNNIRTCELIGLWFEDFYYTRNWVHFQIVPPNSAKRFFIP